MRAALSLATISLIALAGCSADPPPAPTPSVTPGPVVDSEFTEPRTATVAPGSCPDVSGVAVAASGMLSIGPFTTDELGPGPTFAPTRKLFVGSQRPGDDTAVVLITDPTGRQTRQRRNAEPQPGSDVQFYPGDLATPVVGRYRFELTIGQDSMCVTVAYR